MDLPTSGVVSQFMPMQQPQQQQLQQQQPQQQMASMNESWQQPQQQEIDEKTISQLVSGLQQAITSGATTLPSKSISQNTESISRDPYVQPDYIPPPTNKDYINDNVTNDEILYNHNRRKNKMDTADYYFNEFKVPIMLFVLYFLFQLPVTKKYISQYFPKLFFKDGNMNIYGILFIGFLFSTSYYFTQKITNI